MTRLNLAIIAFIISFFASLAVYPFLLKFAKRHNIVDNPNARKLQRKPVPVFGGPVVWVGFMAGFAFLIVYVHSYNMILAAAAMTLLLIVGIIDDNYNLSPALRFLIEVGVVWAVMAIGKRYVDDFHGLWGIDEISIYVSIPLSLIAGVGIINAINLMDGVDGLSSGFGIFSTLIFAAFQYKAGSYSTAYLAVAVAGALMPFFLHNVFGRKSKMFIGDGGTLMLGTVLTILVFNILYHKAYGSKFVPYNVGLIPFALSVMAMPVFDTVRVMGMRIIRRQSPFNADKTHLHHLFIDMKFSHIGTTVAILTLNALIVAIWFLSWKLGASIDLQLYIVIFFGLLFTFGLYKFMRWHEKRGTRFYYRCCAVGRKTHIARTGFWKFMMNFMDWGRGYDKMN